MARKGTRGTRVMGGRYFNLYQVEDSKAEAQRIAAEIRDGKRVGLYGYAGPHFVRVVRYGWHDLRLSEDVDLNRWAIYILPR